MRVTVLAGGVGAARFLRGLVRAVPPTDVTAVVNTGDDTELHGLAISPDLDTVTYTLADAIEGLLADRAHRDRLGAVGRRRAAEFDWATTARRTAEVYRRLGS